MNVLRLLGRRYALQYERRPLAVAVGTGLGIKTSADAFAQLGVEGRESLDPRRTAAMAVFSASVGGVGNYLFVRQASKVLAACGGGLRGAVAAAAADVCCFCPLVYLPTYTAAMGLAAGSTTEEIGAQLRRGYADSWLSSLAIMGPAQVANFLWVPYPLRLPFMLSAAFAYNASVSVINLRVMTVEEGTTLSLDAPGLPRPATRGDAVALRDDATATATAPATAPRRTAIAPPRPPFFFTPVANAEARTP